LSNAPAWMRCPVATPTSRSAAVRRGLAASARVSASLIVSTWECESPVNHGLTRNAAAHAKRVTILQIMKLPDKATNRALARSERRRSGQVFGRRRIEPRMILKQEGRRDERQRNRLRRRLGD